MVPEPGDDDSDELDDESEELEEDAEQARSLLAKSPGVIAVPGDMRDPAGILSEAGLARADQVVAVYEDGYDRLRADRALGTLPRVINFITGPSRTADIEQHIELGAHGPRRLHIVLVEGSWATRSGDDHQTGTLSGRS